jgi:hypothetical protein
MTISPSPASRNPVVLSRNECFSIPVIQCLGFFFGIAAASLSVSISIRVSLSVTRTHGRSSAGSAVATTPRVRRRSIEPQPAWMAAPILMAAFISRAPLFGTRNSRPWASGGCVQANRTRAIRQARESAPSANPRGSAFSTPPIPGKSSGKWSESATALQEMSRPNLSPNLRNPTKQEEIK